MTLYFGRVSFALSVVPSPFTRLLNRKDCPSHYYIVMDGFAALRELGMHICLTEETYALTK